MLSIASGIVALVFLTVPVVIILVCVAVMQGEKGGGPPRVSLVLLALVGVLLVLVGTAFAGCSLLGSG
jgi:hypothetical protein